MQKFGPNVQKAVSVVALSVLAGTAACSKAQVRNSAPQATASAALAPVAMGKLACVAEYPEDWIQTPLNLDVQQIANQLNVSPQQVQTGRFGMATCAEGVTMHQANIRQASVEGIGSHCLVMAIDPPSANANALQHQIDAVCATQ